MLLWLVLGVFFSLNPVGIVGANQISIVNQECGIELILIEKMNLI